MKNKLVFLVVSVFGLTLFVTPNMVSAKTETTDLKETVKEEIELFKSADGYEDYVKQLEEADLSNYEESKDKVNVYFFRGSTCSHCFEATVFFANIAKEYGQYFNLKAYEVWSNNDNAALMEKVGNKLGDDVSGVPYIVIGKKSWTGYASSYDDEIKSEIKSQYDKKVSDRDDVVKNLNVKDSTSSSSSDVVALLIIVLAVAGITTGIVYTRKNAS